MKTNVQKAKEQQKQLNRKIKTAIKKVQKAKGGRYEIYINILFHKAIIQR